MLRRTTCRVCNSTIAREDIDQASNIAVCHNCGTVTRLNAPAEKPKNADADPDPFPDMNLLTGDKPKRLTSTHLLPEGVQQTVDHEGLKITLYREAMYGNLIGGIAVLVIMGMFSVFFFIPFITTFTAYGFSGLTGDSMFLLFMVGMFVFVGYSTLTTLLNRVEITVSPGHIHTHTLPLPTLNRASVDPADILQVYCRDRLHRSKNATWKTYEVRAILHSGRHVNIVTGLGDAMPALYVEEAIEDYLSLNDSPVPGELRRRW